MSASIITLLEEYRPSAERLVDLTFSLMSSSGVRYRRGLPDPALSAYLPQVRYPSAKLLLAKMAETRPTIASIVGVDGDIPLRRDPVDFSLEQVGSAKLARARMFTESDFDLLHEAEMHLAANQPQLYAKFVERYTQTPAILMEAITSLASLLMLQLFAAGACTYIDPETNLGFELSYVSQIPATNRPAALSGSDTWTTANVATSKPLEVIRDHLNAYYANVFMMPEAILMGSAVADGMLNSQDTKYKIGRMLGRISDSVNPGAQALASLPRPSIEECRMWLANEITAAAQGRSAVPQFIVSDAEYYTVGSDGRIAANGTAYHPAKQYSFMNRDLVEGAYVPTATNNYADSFAMITEPVSMSPKREKLSIDTRFLAVCFDPRMLGFRQVLP